MQCCELCNSLFYLRSVASDKDSNAKARVLYDKV